MRTEPRILLGVDCDRPRTAFRTAQGYLAELEEVADYLRVLTQRWARAEIGWTMFLCGQFVRALADLLSSLNEVRCHLGVGAAGCETACHTEAHHAIGPVVGRPDLTACDPAELRADLTRNTRVLESLTGTQHPPFGFRAPYGYSPGALSESALDVIAATRGYLSSHLRTERHGICPPLVDRGKPRQPFKYPNGLWEIPSHGWHDTVFADMSPTSPGAAPGVTAWDHYSGILLTARDLGRQLHRPIYVGLVLHPIAMARYDPDAILLDRLLDVAGPDMFLSYGGALRGLQASQGLDQSAPSTQLPIRWDAQ